MLNSTIGADEIVINFTTQLITSVNQTMPFLMATLIFIVIGYILGWAAKKIVITFLDRTDIDDWMEQQNLLEAIGNRKISVLVGSILKWYIFFIFLKQALEFSMLLTLNAFLGFWINFALLIIAALIVVIIGLIVARYVRNAIELSKNPFNKIFGLVFEVTLVYIAVVMAIRMVGFCRNSSCTINSTWN